MGRKNRLSIQVREDNPYCVFCAGSAKSVAVDHCPPKIIFTGKDRPKGLEFGICDECHQPTRPIDQIVAICSRFMQEPSTQQEMDDLLKFRQALANNHPEIVALFSNVIGWQGGKMIAQVEGDHASRLQCAMHAFCARLALGLYQEKIGKPAPAEMRIYTAYYSSHDIFAGRGPRRLFELMPDPAELKAGIKATGKQFRYASHHEQGYPQFTSFAIFRESFCPFVIITPERLDFEMSGSIGAVLRPGFLKGLDYRDVAQWQALRFSGLT